MTDWPSQDVDKLKELHGAGYSRTGIGKEMGKTRGAVSGKIGRLGLRSQQRRVRPKPKPKPPKVRIRKKKAPPNPPTASKPATPALPSGPVLLLNLETHHCRGIADHLSPDGLFMFCAAPQIKGSSYCASHHARYVQPDRYQRS